jgi:hypothetical protein
MWQLSSQAHYPTIHSQIGENILLFYITNRIILEEQIIAFDSSRPSVDVKQVHVNIQHQTHAMGCGYGGLSYLFLCKHNPIKLTTIF